MHKKQLIVFSVFLGIYALIAAVSYIFFFEQMTQGATLPTNGPDVPHWVLGLANAGIILVFYGLLGLAGYWFARQLDLPGIFSTDGNWKRWFFKPLVYGVSLGVFLLLVDELVAISGMGVNFPHPAFPFSTLASASAAIGEEILTRSFVFGLWAWLLNFIFKRWDKTNVALWIANVIAALVFGASHLYTAALLFGVIDPTALPPVVIAEIFLLNGVIGLAAGERYMKDGLVAAMGVHFWTDIVWHVLWPLLLG
jgi:membrane protease YdiL (CAAX protease family)